MINISAVIITYNEEKNIARCLDSLQGLADEIIVVDSFSTDRTEDICKNYDLRFVKHNWEGYVKTKNFANNLASYDTIFSIDADEAVSPELKESILKIKSQAIDNKVFKMNRLMNYCGKWIYHCGWYPDAKIRIFDRRFVYWIGDKVHETLYVPADFTCTKLNGNLLHYSFYTINQHIAQSDKFSTLSAQSAFEKGKKVSKAKIVMHVFWNFVRNYFFNLGFLDGRYGLIICKINAKSTYWKYKKLLNLYKNNHEQS